MKIKSNLKKIKKKDEIKVQEQVKIEEPQQEIVEEIKVEEVVPVKEEKVEFPVAYENSFSLSKLLSGKKNIYCGELSKIGKTTTIKDSIRSFLANNPNSKVIVLMPTNNYEYDDLLREELINIAVPQNLNATLQLMLSPKNAYKVYLYSDEVPDAEQLLQGWNTVTYMGGFFSRPLTTNEHNLLVKSEKREVLIRVADKLRDIIGEIEKI